MRVRVVAATTTLLSLAYVAPVHGHAELVPWQLPPGADAGLLLLVTHGCGDEEEWISTEPLEEEPTVAVTVHAPIGLELVPHEVEGWTLTAERDESGRVATANWKSDDPEGTYETLQIPMDVSVGDVPDGSQIWLPVVQDCAGGASLSWTHEGDLRGGDEVPAMRLIVNEDATAPPPHGERASSAGDAPGYLDRLGPVSFLLAVLGLGAAGIVVARRR